MRKVRELHPSELESLPDGAEPDQPAGLVPEVQAELAKDENWWKSAFSDILEDLPEGQTARDYYYKAECRPLKILKPLHRIGFVNKVHNHSFREWLELRDRARKDLYWLGKECIATEQSGANFVPHVHGEMCAMFVQKDFDGVYYKGYTLTDVRQAIGRQQREKEMLLLAPRGSFKSTVNKVDCAQWLLNCPDIRIFIITGAADLSDKFLKEVKGFFYKPERTNYTYFQSLFPEYVITTKAGITAGDMICPARLCRQEGNPSLWVNSIGGVLAGWHCDLMKGDDIVNEENSNNEDTREKLKARYDNVSANLPDEWAFRDQLGTRYFEDDWYGDRILDMRTYGSSNELKYLKRAAWTVKAGYENVPIKQLQEHMVELYFPEKLTFKSLSMKVRSNEKQYRCQQLNEPAGSDVAVNFDIETLKLHEIIQNKVPRPTSGERRLAICWDTAHSDNIGSDYSAGAVGYCHEETRALYVLDVRMGKWKDSELAVHIVDMHFKWKPMFTEIEKFPGYELLAAEIQRVAWRMYGQRLMLAWRDLEQGFGSKRNRVKGLEVLLANDRLWFVENDWTETGFQQFTRFNGFSKRRKDDIPDAISFLQRLIPFEQQQPKESLESEADRKAREADELKQKFAQRHNEMEYGTLFQTPAPLPAPAPKPVKVVDEGPGRMFGGIGIHL